jgi:DNA-binding protein HU-beta
MGQFDEITRQAWYLQLGQIKNVRIGDHKLEGIAMTKPEFVASVATQCGLSHRDTQLVIDTTLETIIALLARGDSIGFAGFGSFATVPREARTIHIPSTGERTHVPARRSIKFRAGKRLKEAISSNSI